MTKVIAVSTPRTDGRAKVTGEAVYGVDYDEPDQLHGALLRSPFAAGTIARLEVEPATSMEGVVAVYTQNDAPDTRAGWYLRDQTLFAKGEVRYEGEPIALVLAETRKLARNAVRAIELDIEQVTPIATVEEALVPGARLVHPEWESFSPATAVAVNVNGNVISETVLDTGGVDEAFAAADLIVEGVYECGRQYQAYLEPKSAVARYSEGRYIIHTAHQFPFNLRDRVAQFLSVRQSDVRVIGHHIGGGFGGKLDAGLEPLAALGARLSGRPVKIRNDRLEDMLTCPMRESATITMRSALSASGEVLGREVECDMDAGAYSSETAYMTNIPMRVSASVYKVGAARMRSRAVYTNTAPTGAFRGVSGTYLLFALERHIDAIADRLGVDRREYRLSHLYEDGAVAPNGQVFGNASIFREAYDAVEATAPWAETGRGKLRGVGLAATMWSTNPMAGSVTLRLQEDGRLGVSTAANDNGSGAIAMGVAQIAAAQLGVGVDDVVITMPDTDAASFDAGSQGSRTTHIVGRATADAGQELRAQIADVAATLLEASPADIVIEEGSVHVRGVPAKIMSLAEIATAATSTIGPLLASASYKTPPPEFNAGCISGPLFAPTLSTVTYHVHLAEVEVEPSTGQVTVTRYVVAQDVGREINPAGVRGQVQGGVAQGIGYALYEGMTLDAGRYRQRSLETCRIPLASDVPEVEIIILEHPDGAGPFGAKGVAEPPVIPVAAAVGNAVADAIGAPITQVPITPEDVLDALRKTERTSE